MQQPEGVLIYNYKLFGFKIVRQNSIKKAQKCHNLINIIANKTTLIESK